MKKAVIITPFDNYSYQVRIKYVEKYLVDREYEVTVLSSDFDHRIKVIYSAKRDNLELLHVPSYRKNLSCARIHSHYVFAKSVFSRLEEISPDLVYCSAPPNFLFKFTSKYKMNHRKVKLIYELGDLWPETLPLKSMVKKLATPVLNIWAGIRNKNIKYADGIIYECQLFSNVISQVHPGVYSQVIYLSKEDFYKGQFTLNPISDWPLRFAYVGSINNIIDIDLIVNFIKAINEKVVAQLVVIGGGENAERLFKLCDEAGIEYENHGITYEEKVKHDILSSCQFGLNIMKNSVAVGVTMKSLEYFHEGLILINNIPADTESIINSYKCGINVDASELIKSVNAVASLDIETITEMRFNSRKAFEDLFETEAIRKQFLNFLDMI